MIFSFGRNVSVGKQKTENERIFFGISFGQILVAERGSTVVWFGVYFFRFSVIKVHPKIYEWKEILKVKKAPTIARHCWRN